MTTEQLKLKTAQNTYTSTKRVHPVLHKNLRDELIRSFIKFKTKPDWLNKFTIA